MRFVRNRSQGPIKTGVVFLGILLSFSKPLFASEQLALTPEVQGKLQQMIQNLSAQESLKTALAQIQSETAQKLQENHRTAKRIAWTASALGITGIALLSAACTKIILTYTGGASGPFSTLGEYTGAVNTLLNELIYLSKILGGAAAGAIGAYQSGTFVAPDSQIPDALEKNFQDGLRALQQNESGPMLILLEELEAKIFTLFRNYAQAQDAISFEVEAAQRELPRHWYFFGWEDVAYTKIQVIETQTREKLYQGEAELTKTLREQLETIATGR